jgi:hypothetical protein
VQFTHGFTVGYYRPSLRDFKKGAFSSIFGVFEGFDRTLESFSGAKE